MVRWEEERIGFNRKCIDGYVGGGKSSYVDMSQARVFMQLGCIVYTVYR
jgi:hypothetical protein